MEILYPALFKIGGMTIHTYGFTMMVALLLIYFLAIRNVDSSVLDRDDLDNIGLFILVSLWVGGSLVYWAAMGVKDLAAIFYQKGFRGVHWMGTVSVLISFSVLFSGYCILKRKPFLKVLDFLTPFFVLGYGVQRTFGCFLSGDSHPAKKDSLFLATNGGLFLFGPNGQAQRVDSRFKTPSSFVRALSDGTVYAFVVDHGLVHSKDNGQTWKILFNAFGNQIPAQIVMEPGKSQRLHILTQTGKLLASHDGGQSWKRFGYASKPLSLAEKRGMSLFQTHCQSCHGVKAVGETLSTRAMTDKSYQMAPALDGSAHAWHHTDKDLVKTILEGATRKGGSRMKGFKEKLSEKDAQDLVAYMKSFWGKRELDCQGPKHMQCM